MAEVVTILQSTIISKFVLPFLLIFFVVFAILEKTKLLGDGQKQINALAAFVIGLIFVSAVFPKEVVGNLVLFLSVAIIVVFVTLLLWGFASNGKEVPDRVKNVAGVAIIIGVAAAVLWAVGIRVEALNEFIDFMFYSSWSSAFWTNILFIGVIVIALAYLMGSNGSSGG